MSKTAPHRLAPFNQPLSEPIFFRQAQVPAHALYPTHQHPNGELVYSYSGVMEVKVADKHYLVPSQYALWLPPNTPHQGLNRHAAWHCSLYVANPDAYDFPKQTCALLITPLISALLTHLREHPPTPPYRPQEQHLLQVLIEQLAAAPCAGSYLPSSSDPLLAPVLSILEANPGANTSLAELAAQVHTSERTLARRSQRDLGMPLLEWRQRLRVLKAMEWLEAGAKVETIALELGYSSASAFIGMFKRLMGMSPDEYRRQRGEG
ncbi:AraC family transcriptional regulator [Balneatrix alpica]|uniref:AraC family transcriptional regulator n=1 Tax=Balneatrix alpica TaxID=75684 RepID=UPI002738ED60|nr:helix-turn-helix transcriptional regulator [Balneatrix alpica]